MTNEHNGATRAPGALAAPKTSCCRRGGIDNSNQNNTTAFAVLLGRALVADGDLTRVVYIVSANARHRTDGVYAKDINVILNQSGFTNSSRHKSSTRNDLPHMGIVGIALI